MKLFIGTCSKPSFSNEQDIINWLNTSPIVFCITINTKNEQLTSKPWSIAKEELHIDDLIIIKNDSQPIAIGIVKNQNQVQIGWQILPKI